jgi:RNA polymerase sigma-54 factor
LQQAIKLLQLSNLELINFLQQEIEQNPLLDWEERAGTDKKPDDSLENQESPALPKEAGSGESADWSDVPIQEAPQQMGDNADDIPPADPAAFETFSLRSHAGSNSSSEPGTARLEDLTAEKISLRDHLRQQFQIVISDPKKRFIADYMIDLIDDAGYMQGSIEDVAERLDASHTDVEEVLASIQTLEPVGVGARTLSECLALQLKDQNRFDPAMAIFLENLELLAARDFNALQRLCKVDMDDLAEMVSEIRALNPRPGLEYGFAAPETVIPDVLVDRDHLGNLRVQLNNETMPSISINHSFYSSAKRAVRSEKDKSYLQNCMTTANWLARSLDQRRQTMLKVAKEIVAQQTAFIELGVRGLKPLALKDVAERIGMHESTVSRVTSNKYMQTPRGTFELKYFFSSSIPSADSGDAHSSEAVRDRIRELVKNESPNKILSDDKIVAMLRKDGVDIARRTVAKYREVLRIPSSVQRRRTKNSQDCPVADARH